MARLLGELSRGSDAGDETDGVLLMGALAEGARHSAAALGAALRRESSTAVTSRSRAPQPGNSAAGVDQVRLRVRLRDRDSDRVEHAGGHPLP